MICRSCCSPLESVKSVESPDDKWSLLTFTCQHHHHNQDEESMKHCIISLHPVDTSTPDSMILHYINGSTVSWSLDHAIGKISKWVDWTKIPNSKLPKPVMLEKYWSLDDWECICGCGNVIGDADWDSNSPGQAPRAARDDANILQIIIFFTTNMFVSISYRLITN